MKIMSEFKRKEGYGSIPTQPHAESYPKNGFFDEDRFPTKQKFKQHEYKNFNPSTHHRNHQPDHLRPNRIKYFFNYPDELLKEIEKLESLPNQLNRLQYTLILLDKEERLPATAEQLMSKIMQMFFEVLERWHVAKEPKENIPELSRFISTLLHRAGRICVKLNSKREFELKEKTQSQKVEISSKLINFLLKNLLERYHNDFNTPGTANALLGIKNLALCGYLIKELDDSYFNLLLEKLWERRNIDWDARAIGTALQSVGNLAYGGYLIKLDSTHLDALLKNLCQLTDINSDAQATTDALKGARYLSSSGCLTKKLNALSIEALLAKLIEKKPRPNDIANALSESGFVAKSDYLIGVLDCSPIDQLLGQLAEKAPTSKNIADALMGVGKLAYNHCLTNKLSCVHIDSLLKQLKKFGQDIIPALIGVGYLAYNERLKGKLSCATLNPLLKQLRENLDIDKEISPALLAVSYLAHQGCLEVEKGEVGEEGINFTEISLLFERLVENISAKGKEISDALLAIGNLAEDGFLKKGELSSNHINSLLARFMFTFEVGTSDIANILRGIGYLARSGCLEEKLTYTHIDSLLQRLSQRKDLDPQAISNALLGLGYLIRAGKYDLNRDDVVTQKPVKQITQTLCAKFCSMTNLDSRNIRQVAQFLSIANEAIPITLKKALAKLRPTPNATQIAIRNYFTPEGISCEPEELIEAWHVDLYIENKLDKYIIELDSSEHYAKDGSLHVRDRDRDQILMEKGLKILRLRNYPENTSELIQYIKNHIESRKKYHLEDFTSLMSFDLDTKSSRTTITSSSTQISGIIPSPNSQSQQQLISSNTLLSAPKPLSGSLFSNSTSSSTSSHNNQSTTTKQSLGSAASGILPEAKHPDSRSNHAANHPKDNKSKTAPSSRRPPPPGLSRRIDISIPTPLNADTDYIP